MTTLHQRAALVLQQIDIYLALAEKATPGPWTANQETLSNGSLFNTINGTESFVCHICSTNFVHEDATFIAASRTLLPTSLRCLKTAIEGLQTILERAEASTLKAYKYSMPAELTLTTLCDQWEAGR